MAEFLVTTQDGSKFKVTAPEGTPDWQISSQVQNYINSQNAPAKEEEDVGFWGAAGNALARMGGRIATAYDNYMAEELATVADAQQKAEERRASGEESWLERLLTPDSRMPGGALYESPEQLRNQAAGYITQGAQRTQDYNERFPMTQGGQQGIQALSNAETFGQGLSVIADQPLNVLSGVAQVGLEQAPVLGASILGSAVTRNPNVGIGIMFGSTYGQERFGQMQEVARDFGYDITKPEDARRAINDERFLAAQEQKGMERGIVIATIDALTLKAGQALPNNLTGLAGNTGLQIVGGGGGEAAAQLVTEGKITKPGEVIIEGLAEGVTAPADVAMLAAGSRNSGSEIPPPDSNQIADEAAILAASQQQEQEQVRTTNRDRLAAAPDFMPFKAFQTQRGKLLEARIRDENSEEGQAFQEWLADTRSAERPAPTTEAELSKEIAAYIKENTPANDRVVAYQEYNAALDEHIAFRNDQAGRSETATAQTEALKARLVAQRAEALAANDTAALAEIERQAAENLLPGEWRYATLVADGVIKPVKGGLSSRFTPQTAAPAQPTAPATGENADTTVNASTDQPINLTAPDAAAAPVAGEAPTVQTEAPTTPDVQSQAPAQPTVTATDETAPAAVSAVDTPVTTEQPGQTTAPETGTAPAVDETPAPQPEYKGLPKEMYDFAVTHLGENWQQDEDLTDIQVRFEQKDSFYKKDKNGQRQFEKKVLEAAAERNRAQEAQQNAPQPVAETPTVTQETPVQETAADQPVAEVQQEDAAPTQAPVDQTDQFKTVRENAISFANEKLGENWQETQPDLVDQLAANDFKGFQTGVEAAAQQQSQEDVATEADTTPTTVEPRELAVSQFETDGLSQNQTAVWTVVRDAFLNNEADNVINPDGSFRFQNIAEIADLNRRDGTAHTSKVGKRNAAQSALKQLRPKIAKAFNVSEEQLAQVLAATRKDRQNVEAAPDINAQTSQLDMADLSEDSGFNVIESANQGARRGLSQEDIKYMEARSQEKDQYENKRQELSDATRRSDTIKMVKQYGQLAVREWNNMSSGAVPVTSLPKKDLMEWVSVIEERESGQISEEQARADQKEIETRVSLDPNVKLEAQSGQQTNTATAEEPASAQSPNTGPTQSAESGNTTEQVGTPNTGDVRQPTRYNSETGQIEAAPTSATVVVNNKKRRAVKPATGTAADRVAASVGGEVVYQNGDLSLVRGYSALTGRPVYSAAIGDNYTNTDVDTFSNKNGEFTAEQLTELRQAKAEAEADALLKHDSSPFITFKDGTAFSQDIPESYRGIIKDWLKELGMGGNIYFTTLADATANRNNFTGPHRAVGSATLNANEKGSARKMEDGSFYVVFDKGLSNIANFEVLAHEMGHVHQKMAFDSAPKELKDGLINAHQEWLKSQQGQSARELVDSLRARKTAKSTPVPEGLSAAGTTAYWKSFSEWYADQVSRWATTQEAPTNAIERFFSRLGRAMKNFYEKLANKDYLPNDAFVEYLAAVKDRNAKAPITDDADLQSDSMASSIEPNDNAETENAIISVRNRVGRRWVKDNLGDTTAQFYDGVAGLMTKPIDYLTFLYDLAESVQDKMPSAKALYRQMKNQEGVKNSLMQEAEKIATRAAALKPERYALVNEFIGKSTFTQQWGYDPKDYHPELFAEKDVKVNPVLAIAFNKMTDGEKQIIADIFAQGESRRQRMQAFMKALGLNNKLFSATSSLQGPYAPLKRFGNFASVLKSKELYDLEQSLKDPANQTPRNNRKLEELRSNADHYVVQFFDTRGAANRFAEANSVKNKGKYFYVDAFSRGADINAERAPSTAVLEQLMGKLKADDKSGLSDEAKEAFRTMLREHYYSMMDERDARTSGARRLNRAGYDKDMIKSFMFQSNAQAKMIATMETGAQVNEALAMARKEASTDRGSLQDTYNLLAEHYFMAMRPEGGVFDAIQDRVASYNTVTMLTTNFTYHLQNFTQVLIGVNKLVGDFGNYSGSWAAMFKGLKIANKAIKGGGFLKQAAAVATVGIAPINNNIEIDNTDASMPPEYQDLVRELELQQLADVGLQEDLRQFNRFDTGFGLTNAASDKVARIVHRLYQVARYVEAHNRLATAIAAYDLAKKNPQRLKILKKDSPIEYAVSAVQRTQGAFNGLDAPLAFKKTGKLPLQYRKYQIMMAFNYGRAAKQAFAGESPEVKMIGWRTLGVTLGHAAITSGIRGMPWVSPIVGLALMFGADDEDEIAEKAKAAGGWDNYVEQTIRENVQDKDLANLLTRGVPAWLGVDFSGKLGHQNFFSIAPYSDLEFTRDGLTSYAFDLIAGPTASTLRNWGAANEARKRGDFWKATEYVMPRGLRQYMESYRYSTEGMTFTNGETMLDPRNIDIYNLMRNAIGLPDNEIQQIKWTRGQQIEIEKYFSERSSELTNDFNQAFRERDTDRMAEIRFEWRDLQRAKNRVRPFFNNAPNVLQPQPLDTLIKSVQSRRREAMKDRRMLGTN